MNNNLNNVQAPAEVKENVVAGIVGAFLFGLAGGALWFGMYLIGYLAGISGLVGAVCAIKGYSVFAKKESTKGIIISTIIAMFILAIAWYFCFAYDIYGAYKVWYEEGEIDFTISFLEAVRATPMFILDPEVGPAHLGDLGLGLLLGLVGAGSYVFTKVKNNKQAAVAPATPVTPVTPVNTDAAEETVNATEETVPVADETAPATEEVTPSDEIKEEAPAQEETQEVQ
jgi:flagellar basal body-associated protein FliL